MVSRRDFLKGTGITGVLAASRVYGADEGLLAGRVTDMFSGQPYDGALVTLVNDTTGGVYQTRTSLVPTAVRATGWGDIKKAVRTAASLKPMAAGPGSYSVLIPNGTYAVAITDGEIPVAKPTAGDLFSLQLREGDRFAPRVFKLGVNGDTRYDEPVVPKDFDWEFAWTVMSGKIIRYDYSNTTFYVDVSPARNRHRPDVNGKRPEQWEIDNVTNAIREFVRLDTNETVTPRIEIGTSPPGDVVPGYTRNPEGRNIVVPGYALFLWDSGLPQGALGVGLPEFDDSGKIISSDVGYRPGFTSKHTALNEVLGAGGLWQEPRVDLDQRIRATGSSVFLDGGTDEITERDAQIIKYHGQRPLSTRPQDVTDKVVNEAF